MLCSLQLGSGLEVVCSYGKLFHFYIFSNIVLSWQTRWGLFLAISVVGVPYVSFKFLSMHNETWVLDFDIRRCFCQLFTLFSICTEILDAAFSFVNRQRALSALNCNVPSWGTYFRCLRWNYRLLVEGKVYNPRELPLSGWYPTYKKFLGPKLQWNKIVLTKLGYRMLLSPLSISLCLLQRFD